MPLSTSAINITCFLHFMMFCGLLHLQESLLTNIFPKLKCMGSDDSWGAKILNS